MGIFDIIKRKKPAKQNVEEFNENADAEQILEVNIDSLFNEISRRSNIVESIAGRLREYKPESITIEDIESMNRNGVVSSGLQILKAPLISIFKKARFEASDPIIEAFLNQEVHPVIMDSLPTILRSMEWGVSFHEKIFKQEIDLEVKYEREIEDELGNTIKEQASTILPTAIIYDKLRFNPYKTIDEIKLLDDFSFDGYVQNIKNSSGFVEKVEIPSWKSFVFTFDASETLWGKTILDPTYPAWYIYELAAGYYARYLEHGSNPPLIGRAPIGTTDVILDGRKQQIDNLNWLTMIASNTGKTTAIVFPSQFDPTSGKEMWDLQELDIGDRSQLYRDALAWIERAILISVLAPQQALGQRVDETGSFSVGEIEFETFLISEFMRIQVLTTAINKWIVKPLVLLNFGEDNEDAEIRVPDITKEIVTRSFQILSQLIKAKHPDTIKLALTSMATELGLPIDETREPMSIIDDEDPDDTDSDEDTDTDDSGNDDDNDNNDED